MSPLSSSLMDFAAESRIQCNDSGILEQGQSKSMVDGLVTT